MWASSRLGGLSCLRLLAFMLLRLPLGVVDASMLWAKSGRSHLGLRHLFDLAATTDDARKVSLPVVTNVGPTDTSSEMSFKDGGARGFGAVGMDVSGSFNVGPLSASESKRLRNYAAQGLPPDARNMVAVDVAGDVNYGTKCCGCCDTCPVCPPAPPPAPVPALVDDGFMGTPLSAPETPAQVGMQPDMQPLGMQPEMPPLNPIVGSASTQDGSAPLPCGLSPCQPAPVACALPPCEQAPAVQIPIVFRDSDAAKDAGSSGGPEATKPGEKPNLLDDLINAATVMPSESYTLEPTPLPTLPPATTAAPEPPVVVQVPVAVPVPVPVPAPSESPTAEPTVASTTVASTTASVSPCPKTVTEVPSTTRDIGEIIRQGFRDAMTDSAAIFGDMLAGTINRTADREMVKQGVFEAMKEVMQGWMKENKKSVRTGVDEGMEGPVNDIKDAIAPIFTTPPPTDQPTPAPTSSPTEPECGQCADLFVDMGGCAALARGEDSTGFVAPGCAVCKENIAMPCLTSTTTKIEGDGRPTNILPTASPTAVPTVAPTEPPTEAPTPETTTAAPPETKTTQALVEGAAMAMFNYEQPVEYHPPAANVAPEAVAPDSFGVAPAPVRFFGGFDGLGPVAQAQATAPAPAPPAPPAPGVASPSPARSLYAAFLAAESAAAASFR